MIENITEQKKAIDLILQQAIALHQAGQIAEAEQLYRRILQTYPNHADAHHNLGLIAMQTGNHAPSLQHFKTAMDFAPDHLPFVLAYANAQLNNGYLLDAMKTVKTARQRGMDAPELKAAQRTIDEAISYSISNPSPSQQEWDPLHKLFVEQKWVELETKAQKLADKYPKSGKVAKMLVIALDAQGKPSLPAKKKAAYNDPADMDLQFNLANHLQWMGQADEAEEVLRKAVSNYPANPVAHCNLGIYLNGLGRVLQGGASLRKALEINPDLIQAHCALATMLQKSGQIDEAKACCQRASQVNTNSPDLICLIGITLYGLGELDEAGKQFNRALAINPLHVESMINLGNVLRAVGLNDDAKKCYFRAIEVQPGAAIAHNNLGLMLVNEGDFRGAMTCYQRAISIAPNYTEAYFNLGLALLVKGVFSEAVNVYRSLLNLIPNSVPAMSGLGAALQGLGKIDEALQCYLVAQRAMPNLASNYCNLASVYQQLGREDDAQAAIDQALKLDSANPSVLSQALLFTSYHPDDPRFAQLESVYSSRERLSTSDRISLCLAYGAAMESIGEIDKAFAAYQEGNRLHYQFAPFDEEGCRQQVSLMRNVMTREKIAALSAAATSLSTDNDSRVPVFIIGMPHSGSTLIEQILSSHPQAHSAGELPLLANLLNKYGEKLNQASSDMNATALLLREIGQDYLDQVWKLAPEARFIVDNMLANFFHVGQIKLMLPQARFIHAVRDPIDTCFSSYALRFAAGHEYTYDLDVLGRYFNDYKQVMQHWSLVLPPGTVLDVQYESIATNLEQETRRLLDYIGLPWDDAIDSKLPVLASSLTQVRNPLEQSSIGRAKPFERHLQPLIQVLKG